MGILKAICMSDKKGTAKYQIETVEMIQEHGLKGDAHAGKWHRQVSLLSFEKIEDFKKRCKEIELGAFGENLVVAEEDLEKLKVGDKVFIKDVELEITQLGKKCHDKCQIYYQVGECIMPKFGIFARVLKGGEISKGDEVILDIK